MDLEHLKPAKQASLNRMILRTATAKHSFSFCSDLFGVGDLVGRNIKSLDKGQQIVTMHL